MNINIIAVGKIKEKYLQDGISEYSKRLFRFCNFKVIEIAENSAENIEKESEDIKRHLKGFVVVLDIGGKQITSEEFSEVLNELKMTNSTISFVIGSSKGLSNQIKNLADLSISFSKMTFPHMLFRLMLTEQIYRAFMISSGGKYHK